jgi:hypothetical protein
MVNIEQYDEGPTYFTAIQGTNSWEDIPLKRLATLDRLYWKPGSRFMQDMHKRGLVQLVTKYGIFQWDTELGGVFWKHGDERGWQANGQKCYHWFDMQNIPYDWKNFFVHSWGGATFLFAVAQGLEVRNVIFFGVPVIKKLLPIAEIARKRINYWHSVVDPDDRIQKIASVIGGLVKDNKGNIVRSFPQSDATDTIDGVGHSKILYEPSFIDTWDKNRYTNIIKMRKL